jgi:hypothetical protein
MRHAAQVIDHVRCGRFANGDSLASQDILVLQNRWNGYGGLEAAETPD